MGRKGAHMEIDFRDFWKWFNARDEYKVMIVDHAGLLRPTSKTAMIQHYRMTHDLGSGLVLTTPDEDDTLKSNET
jgi:hypothetical protein